MHLPVFRRLQSGSPEILVAGLVGVCMYHSSVTTNLASYTTGGDIRDDPGIVRSHALFVTYLWARRTAFQCIRFFPLRILPAILPQTSRYENLNRASDAE